MGYSTPDAYNITFGHIASCNHNQKMPKDNGLGQKKLAKMAKDLAEERERNNNQ